MKTMSKEKENVEGGPMDGPLFIDKDNIIAKGGIMVHTNTGIVVVFERND